MKNKNDEKENPRKWTIFRENYKNNKAFRSFVKLIGYFVFIFIIVILAMSIPNEEIRNTTNAANKVSYKEILEKLFMEDQALQVSIEIGEQKYNISANNSANILEGYLENADGIHKFRLENNHIYEIVMNDARENNTLFADINLDFIIPANLVRLLERSQSIKQVVEKETTYTYQVNQRDIDYTIIVYEQDDKINKIVLTAENSSYTIIYE